jgi:hydrogenase-4 component F
VTSREQLAVATVALPAALAVAVALVPRRAIRPLALLGALATAGVAGTLALVALADPSVSEVGRWIVVDAAGGLLVATIAAIGLVSALVSPTYLDGARSSVVRRERAERTYWAVLLAFWAVLLAVPLAGNLGAAWIAIEATTAASALLVGFSGKPRALEAGWKYLILTSLGLGVALLGIVVVAGAGGGASLDALAWRTLPHLDLAHEPAVVGYVLIIAGLAAKAGWAPVHNWLPDAHSEAPPPVSALLSAALLPAVVLVAWRTQQALSPAVGVETARGVLVAFGLASLAIAIPFLWRGLAWKRLLAYSSLEHMGVLALAVGFGSTLALAGLAIHLTGHALAKGLGFYAATPLLAHDHRAAGHPVAGIARTEPRLALSLGISLATLAALPPLPLFASEVLVVAGGFQAGRPYTATAATILLALGFLGLAHALVELLGGRPRRGSGGQPTGLRGVLVFTGVATALLLALTVTAFVLPDSALVEALVRGLR